MKKLGLLIASAVLIAPLLVTSPTQAASYTPPSGPVFSRPGDGVIARMLLRNINNTPRGAYIRVAVWSFTDRSIANALVRAKNRGVVVRVIMAGGQARSWAARRLRNQLGTKTSRKSWFHAARNSTRGADVFAGKRTAHHAKYWTFSTTGTYKRVTVITSGNPTDSARTTQWTDSYTYRGDYALYDRMVGIFVQSTRDRRLAKPFYTWSSGKRGIFMSPWNSPTMADPVVKRIQGLPDNARIRIANSAWWGARGERIARAVAAHERADAGKDVWVLASSPFGAGVRKILRSAGVTIYKGYYSKTRYHHLKLMTARWPGKNGPVCRQWTGSENWSDDSRGADEIVVRNTGCGPDRRYAAFFDSIHP